MSDNILTLAQQRYIKKLVHDFDWACRDLAFKGTQHPADWPGIEARYKETRQKLINYMENRRG